MKNVTVASPSKRAPDKAQITFQKGEHAAKLSVRSPIPGARIVHVAFIVYWLSYALPAVTIAGDTVFGYLAAALSFLGALTTNLESGQGPACFVGAFANILVVAGYLTFNLRRYRAASWMVSLAALGAVASAGFLATGGERFVPLIGYFVWLASMVTMAVASWKLSRSEDLEDATTHDKTRAAVPIQASRKKSQTRAGKTGRHWLKSPYTKSAACGFLIVGVWLSVVAIRDSRHNREDQKIVNDVEHVLHAHFSQLPKTDPVIERYGRFIRLSDTHWDRPNYPFMLISRIDYSTNAEFENGSVPVNLGISFGHKVRISRLHDVPSDLESAEFRERAGEIWWVRGDFGGPCKFDGWASHRDYSSR